MVNDTFNQPRPKAISPVARQKVLLVDENGRDLKYYRLILESHDFDVSVCKSFEAGVECLETENFDFVMVDQGTSEFEGRMVVDRALQLNRYLPVLVVTALLDIRCYVEAIQMGALDYLEKPLAPSFLLRLVLGQVGRSRPREQAAQHGSV